MNYKVVHHGVLNNNIPVDTIQENLSQLLDLSIDEIQAFFFSNQPYTLIKNLNEEDANEYVKAVHEAGALVVKELDIDLNDIFEDVNVVQQHKHQSAYSTEYEKSGMVKKEFTLQESKETTTNQRKVVHDNVEYTGRSLDTLHTTDPLLLSPTARIGRVRFIIRIFVLFSLVAFVNNILNIRLFDWLGNTAITISLVILIGLGLCLLSIITQRLSDLNRPMTFTVIVLLPIILASFSTFSIRLDKVRYEQMKFGQAMGSGLFLGNHKLKSDDIDQLKERIERLQNKEESYQEYRTLYAFSYIALFALIFALLILPGSRKNNVYGAPPRQIGLLSLSSAIAATFIFLISFLAPSMMNDYEERKIQYDTAFFETFGIGQYLPYELQSLYEESLGKKTK